MWRTGGESLLGLFLKFYGSCGENMWAGKRLWSGSGKCRSEAASRKMQCLLHRTCLIWGSLHVNAGVDLLCGNLALIAGVADSISHVDSDCNLCFQAMLERRAIMAC